ncbi:MAG: hypothetical protein IH591_08095 [Bacteroidales bacterium]|nr:hypothetical protein [Bacteroidales bacterium]
MAKDIATVLAYSNHIDAISRHCKGVVKRYPLQAPGGQQNLRVINEPDVYRLIVNSKLEGAAKFESWVFEEVLPTIRKTDGAYLTEKKAEELINNPELVIGLTRQVEEGQPIRVSKVPIPIPRSHSSYSCPINNLFHYQQGINRMKVGVTSWRAPVGICIAPFDQ